MVHIAPPPPTVSVEPTYFTLTADSSLIRFYNPDNHGQQALTFRHFGPLKRFDHQDLVNDEAAFWPQRGILYASDTFSGCLVEIFGDTRLVEVGAWEVAQLKNITELLLLDLRGNGAMRAGTVAAVCKDSNHRLSQQWSRFFYEHHYLYKMIDGIVFENAHNEETAFALYERCSGVLSCVGQSELRDEALRGLVLQTAKENNIDVTPY